MIITGARWIKSILSNFVLDVTIMYKALYDLKEMFIFYNLNLFLKKFARSLPMLGWKSVLVWRFEERAGGDKEIATLFCEHYK